MVNLSHIASSTIPRGNSRVENKYPNGDTTDIIRVILYADQRSSPYTKEFSKHLKGKTILETCRNIWASAKASGIVYVEDGFTEQNIKSPAQLLTDKKGDCKSFTIWNQSLLQNLGIKYLTRFTGYNGSTKATHVYTIVPIQKGVDQIIIIDSVWPSFNSEKRPISYLKDIPMTQINYVSGIGKPAKKSGILNLGDGNLSEGEMELAIAQQRLEIRRDQMNGIGSPLAIRNAEKIQDALDAVIDARKHFHDEERIGAIIQDIDNGQYKTSDAVSGIANESMRFAKRLEAAKRRDADQYSRMKSNKLASLNKRLDLHQGKIQALRSRLQTEKLTDLARQEINKEINQRTSRITRLTALKNQVSISGTNDYIAKSFFGKLIKKATSAAKKVGKTLLKAVTFPARLAAKGILEVGLPKAAPFFMYLFVTDPALIEKMGDKARRKRKKAEKLANFIVKAIGMKRSHFMGIIRNALIKRFKMEPEKYLALAIKGRVNGIGFAPALIGPIIEIIKTIMKVFGKKTDEMPTEADVPNPTEDFVDLGAGGASSFASEVTAQPGYTPSGPDITELADGGGGGSTEQSNNMPEDLSLDETGGRNLAGDTKTGWC